MQKEYVVKLNLSAEYLIEMLVSAKVATKAIKLLMVHVLYLISPILKTKDAGDGTMEYAQSAQ
jgi:hypothetical protein